MTKSVVLFLFSLLLFDINPHINGDEVYINWGGLAWAAEMMETPDVQPSEEVAEEDPYANVLLPLRLEFDPPLIELWQYIESDEMDLATARSRLQHYLLSPAGVAFKERGRLANSYLFHLLLAKIDLLKAASEHSDAGENKGIFWFSEGILRIYDNQSAQAKANFEKGIFSVASLKAEDYHRLEEVGIKVKYWPSMNPYSNAAFLTGFYAKMSLDDKQQVLNLGIGRKIVGLTANLSDYNDPNSETYMLLGLYYNLAADVVLEGHNDFYAKEVFDDSSDDLLVILRDKFGFDARELFR